MEMTDRKHPATFTTSSRIPQYHVNVLVHDTARMVTDVHSSLNLLNGCKLAVNVVLRNCEENLAV